MANETRDQKKPAPQPKRYRVQREVWISHECRRYNAGDVITVTWPEGTEPKLNANSSLVEITGKEDDASKLAG